MRMQRMKESKVSLVNEQIPKVDCFWEKQLRSTTILQLANEANYAIEMSNAALVITWTIRPNNA